MGVILRAAPWLAKSINIRLRCKLLKVEIVIDLAYKKLKYISMSLCEILVNNISTTYRALNSIFHKWMTEMRCRNLIITEYISVWWYTPFNDKAARKFQCQQC